jgi:hypothetical protein
MNHSLDNAFLTNHGRRANVKRTDHEQNPRIFLARRQHRSALDAASKCPIPRSRPAGARLVTVRADATAFHTNYERCSAAYRGFPCRGNSPELRHGVPATGVPITRAAIGAADHGLHSSQASAAPSSGSPRKIRSRERGLDPGLINHLRRLPFPEEEKSRLDEIYPRIVELDEDEYTGDKQTEEER